MGEYGDSEYISNSAALISPDPAGAPVPDCIRNLTDFPLQIYGGAGASIGTMIGTSKVSSLRHKSLYVIHSRWYPLRVRRMD